MTTDDDDGVASDDDDDDDDTDNIDDDYMIYKICFLFQDEGILGKTDGVLCGFFVVVCENEGGVCTSNATDCTNSGIVVAEVLTLDFNGCLYPLLQECVCQPQPSDVIVNVTVIDSLTFAPLQGKFPNDVKVLVYCSF